jgi:hypothetical protein
MPMPLSVPHTKIDPLRAFMAGAFIAGSERPVPLVGTCFDVRIEGGLATVVTRRTFRNVEADSIEATITFPIPVHAVLYDLEARIGERTVKAKAQRKATARETYEEAIERGKAAVLHEEVLRGVHMLSVAHIAPGAEIEVVASWAITLTQVEGHSQLRIPLTVGDIYGQSGLPDSDDLIHGGPVQQADLNVVCGDGVVSLKGGTLRDGRARIPLNAPIDLEVTGWSARTLPGRAADGRAVSVQIEPAPVGEAPLNVAILIDHSGSMGEICSTDRASQTKHAALVAALRRASNGIAASDTIDLWEFDDGVRRVGMARHAQELSGLLDRVSDPSGGTEIGRALAKVTAQSGARDVLLVTDGKSHALDVQALAQAGRRFTVVLVGEDSLEANVGHLAALTGGEIFVGAGADIDAVVSAALRSLRTPGEIGTPIVGEPQRIAVRRAGMQITAEWTAHAEAVEATALSRAVAACAASLALPLLDMEAAGQLAEAEGLVTHLTSLVLVDQAGTALEGVPATRKIALPAPATALSSRLACMMPSCTSAQSESFDSYSVPFRRSDASPGWPLDAYRRTTARALRSQAKPPRPSFSIDWDAAPKRLQAGDLSSLDADMAKLIKEAAALDEVCALARSLGLDPVVLVVGLLARMQGASNRSAARIVKAIFGRRPAKELEGVTAAFGKACGLSGLFSGESYEWNLRISVA